MPSRDNKQVHLASLYYVASNLIRKGFFPRVYKNRKPNIIAKRDSGMEIRINVKGLTNHTEWIFDKPSIYTADFYILLNFNKPYENIESNPEIFIFPTKEIEPLLERYKGKLMGMLPDKANKEFQNAWNLLYS